MNNKQKLILFLFPPQTEKPLTESEYITNKKFIFMVTVAISLIVIMEIIK